MSILSCVPYPPASKIMLFPAFCNFWQFLPLVSPSTQSFPPSSKPVFFTSCVEVSCTFSNENIYCPFRQFWIKSVYQILNQVLQQRCFCLLSLYCQLARAKNCYLCVTFTLSSRTYSGIYGRSHGMNFVESERIRGSYWSVDYDWWSLLVFMTFLIVK